MPPSRLERLKDGSLVRIIPSNGLDYSVICPLNGGHRPPGATLSGKAPARRPEPASSPPPRPSLPHGDFAARRQRKSPKPPE